LRGKRRGEVDVEKKGGLVEEEEEGTRHTHKLAEHFAPCGNLRSKFIGGGKVMEVEKMP
jgi:hypothetical protein